MVSPIILRHPVLPCCAFSLRYPALEHPEASLYVCMYVCVYANAQMHLCMCVCVNVCMYVCINECMYVCKCPKASQYVCVCV